MLESNQNHSIPPILPKEVEHRIPNIQKSRKDRTFNKYAGHGGCGYVGDYDWNEILKNFELSKFVKNSDCNKLVETSKWQIIYQR